MTTYAWLPAYSVAVSDDQDKPLAALAFAPLQATRQRLAGLGLIFRSRPSGFALFARFIGGKDGVRQALIPGETLLSFAIRLVDVGFLEAFQPAPGRDTGPNLYLSNRTDASTVRVAGRLTRTASAGDGDICRIVPRRFAARADLTGVKPTNFALATAFAPPRALPDVAIDGGAGEASVQVDLSAAPERAFTLTASPPGDAPRLVVVEDGLAGQGAFGLLDLYLKRTAGRDPAGGRAFTAKFKPV